MRNDSSVRGLSLLPLMTHRVRSRSLLFLALLSLALLCACAMPGQPGPAGSSGSSGSSAQLPKVNLAGFPAEYRKAYGDGCAIARNGGSLAQAPVFAPAEQQSAQGWRDSFDYCKARPR